jgi:hypothetical protein
MRVQVIANATAGKLRRAPERLEQVRGACAGRARLHVTRSIAELEGACGLIAASEAELVILVGGDGTHMAGVTELERACGPEAMPIVALAPGGHAGTVAAAWNGLRLDPAGGVRAALDRWSGEGPSAARARPCLALAHPDGARRLGFIFGAGLVASFFRAFYRAGGGGYAKAGWLAARVAAGSLAGGRLAGEVLSPTACALAIDGERHPAQAFTLIASSVIRDLGLHLRVTHRGGEDPRRVHLVAASMSARDCGHQLGRVLRGRPLIGNRVVDAAVGGFEVQFPVGCGTYVLDGDLVGSDAVAVRPGPSLRVLSLQG